MILKLFRFHFFTVILCLEMFFGSGFLGAQTAVVPDVKVSLDLVLTEYPFNFQFGYAMPSMAQSLSFTKSVDALVFYPQERFLDRIMINSDPIRKNTLKFSYFFALEIFMFYLPLGDAWLHESFHQSVMKIHGIESYNEVYEFQFFSPSISVSHVKDEDLAALKAKSNPDFVRLHAAGNEANILLATELGETGFFRQEPWVVSRQTIIFMNLLNSSLYVQMCTTPAAEEKTKEMNQSEGSDIPSRDFTGLDFTAWIYDLFRPNEPYSARGLHPYGGLGIARYISPSQLTGEEKAYLSQQASLSFLNFIDTSFIPLDLSVAGTDGVKIRTAGNLRYHMSSFGNSIQANLYLKRENLNLAFSYHNYTNKNNYFPGLEMKIVDYPLEIGGMDFKFTPRVLGWLQPKNQSFTTGDFELGYLLDLKAAWGVTDFSTLWIKGTKKSPGWVAGNEYLSEHFSLSAGLSLEF